jgi:hypothetical protein
MNDNLNDVMFFMGLIIGAILAFGVQIYLEQQRQKLSDKFKIRVKGYYPCNVDRKQFESDNAEINFGKINAVLSKPITPIKIHKPKHFKVKLEQ